MYAYCFVLEELSTAQQIIQIGHACHEMEPPPKTCNIVLFKVKGEQGLKEIKALLDFNEIDANMFFEPDIDSYTAICTEPVDAKLRTLFKRFSLYK